MPFSYVCKLPIKLHAVLLLFAACLFINTGYGQADADSLKNAQLADEAYTLLSKARSSFKSNPEESVKNIETALQIGIQLTDLRIEAYCYYTLGGFHQSKRNYARSISYYLEGLKIFKDLKDVKGQYMTLEALAITYESDRKSDKAIQMNTQLLNRATETDNKVEMAQIMIRLGRLNQSQKNFPIAADWYKKALKTHEDRKDTKGVIEVLNYLGMLYQETGENDKALEYFTLAGEKAQESKDAGNISISYQSLGSFYRQQKDLSKELDVLLEAIKVNREVKNEPATRDNALRISRIYIELEKYAEAEEFLAEAEILCKKTKASDKLKDVLQMLAFVYENQGEDDKAYLIYKRITALNDSIHKVTTTELLQVNRLDEELSRKISEINYLKLLTKEKNDSLKLVRKENEVIELRLERQKQEARMRQTLIYGLSGIVLILLVSAFLVLKSSREKRKANRMLALQNLRSQMNPHFIFNSLNSINSFIARNDERSANKYLSEFSKLMRAVLENSKHNFVSMSSELEVLKRYLELEHLRFTEKFDYDFGYDTGIDSEEIMVPPMLVQPYIENSVWHGLRYKEEKGHLNVYFSRKEDHILCVVEDNGIGRKKSAELKTRNQQHKGESTALKNIEQRLKIINEIHDLDLRVKITDLDAGGATGTKVEIMIPFISNDLKD